MNVPPLSPTVVRARAGLIATEQGLLGLAAGTAVAMALLATVNPSALAPIVSVLRWIVVAIGGLGLALTIAARVLEIGEAPRHAPVLGQLHLPLVICAAAMVLGGGIGALLTNDFPADSGALAALWGNVPAAFGVIATLALRSDRAATPQTALSMANLSQPISHSLLAGLATTMIVGLMTGKISAGLTYQAGVATAAVAAATIFATGLCVRRIRARLHLAATAGARYPVAEQAYRLAAGATVVGLMLPAAVIVADLLAARLTLLVLAATALAVSNHAVRYALVASHLSLPNPKPRGAGRD